MIEAFAGIDVAFAKRKRLPVLVCTHQDARLVPLPLRQAAGGPPAGLGNAKAIDPGAVTAFVEMTAAYLRSVETTYGIKIRRIAIDAPSVSRQPDFPRRRCESALDERGIRCITTPSAAGFEAIREKVSQHLASGGSESRIPAANQLWMLVGFALFRRLRLEWECFEVFPQAIVSVLGAGAIHKRRPDGLHAQLTAVARFTQWPVTGGEAKLKEAGFGSQHDLLDAYLAAWMASLDENDREALGRPPDDVIWIPKLPAQYLPSMTVGTKVTAEEARRRREAAAAKYKPAEIDLLLVAETPPEELDRYFYFEDVREHDHLFWGIAKVLLQGRFDRSKKPELLGQLKERRVFLVDLNPDPADGSPLDDHVDALVDTCSELKPKKIVLIKVSVYDVAFAKLKKARLPVIDERIPFPSSGQQTNFEEKFRVALQKGAQNQSAD